MATLQSMPMFQPGTIVIIRHMNEKMLFVIQASKFMKPRNSETDEKQWVYRGRILSIGIKCQSQGAQIVTSPYKHTQEVTISAYGKVTNIPELQVIEPIHGMK